MGREINERTEIRRDSLERYLRSHNYPDAEIQSLRPLGQDTETGLKSYGYGHPLHVTFQSGGQTHELVLRTMSPDPFGHDRHADRAGNMILAYETFHLIPDHIEAKDLGAFTDDGELLSIPHGEFFLVTNYVEGNLYAQDLHTLQGRDQATARDLDRARTLASFLARLHAEKTDPETYTRFLRDTVGSGEGLLGLCDSFPLDDPTATPQRLQAIERKIVTLRWELRKSSNRACRTHGDFHPFNILFRDGTDYSILDCSRGATGDAADDVVCLGINYLFFALQAGEFTGALRATWDVFWRTYLDETKDTAIFSVVPLVFAWRGLVLANPTWYPGQSAATRETLLRAIERLLDGTPFEPFAVDDLLSAG